MTRPAPARLHPPDGPTGLKTPGCYAEELADCDGGPLTGEHYISAALLEQIGKVVTFVGFPWANGEARTIGVAAATARILCRRHNEALSALDGAAGRFFRCLVDFHQGRASGVYSFAGEDIERWMMKILFGLAASGNLGRQDGQRLRGSPERELLEMLFMDRDLPEGRGLYFFEVDDPELRQNVVTIIPKAYPPGHAEEGRLFGISVILVGFGLCTSITTGWVSEGTVQYRPRGFVLEETARIELSWTGPCSDAFVVVSRTPLASSGAPHQ